MSEATPDLLTVVAGVAALSSTVEAGAEEVAPVEQPAGTTEPTTPEPTEPEPTAIGQST